VLKNIFLGFIGIEGTRINDKELYGRIIPEYRSKLGGLSS
jgi:hypothetical protein